MNYTCTIVGPHDLQRFVFNVGVILEFLDLNLKLEQVATSQP